MSDFEREERYIVVKLRDLNSRQREFIDMAIEGADVQTVECVVVESDWPNYEHTWQTVEQVANGEWDDGRWVWQADKQEAVPEGWWIGKNQK